MAYLVVGLSAALHLKWLAPQSFVHAGPRLRNDPENGLFATNSTPDISLLCKDISRHGIRIDAIIVFVDCFSLCQFRPSRFPDSVPVLAIIGDTHHGDHPITSLARWLRLEQITRVALKQTVHHGQIFMELGFATTLMPYYLHDPVFIPPSQRKVDRVLFCGSVTSQHRKRLEVLDYIRRAGVALDVVTTNRNMSFRLYNRYIATINIPLNMDINYRFHEVVASGGCLITEQPCAESEKAILLDRGDDYIPFSSPSDAVDKIQMILNNPKQAHEVAVSGYEKLINSFRSGVLLDLLRSALKDNSYRVLTDLEWQAGLVKAASVEWHQLMSIGCWKSNHKTE